MSTPASGSVQSSNPPVDPTTAELHAQLIEETLKRTNGEKRPHDWQLKVALDMLAGHDTLTIAGTGSGKTLPFVMPTFVLKKAIIWILAPLNYIQEQQVKDFESMGLSAVCVNQSTRWKETKKDIIRGKYQVVISSPEAFLDVDKLHGVILSQELADYRHFVVVDEAHVIKKWGGEFCVAYSRVGDLRAALHGVPFSAATATATEAIKNAIIMSLHLGAYRSLQITNRGNFRPNIEHSVHRMAGGAESYKEITHLFPDPTNIKKTLIFVNNVEQAKGLVHELRQHLKLTGDDRYRVRAYFANRSEAGKIDAAEAFKAGQCDILVTTEALTMGCDFADVELVIQYTAPNSVVTHIQRMGRGARWPNIRCQAIMMITASDHERAVKLSGGGRAREGKPDDFLDPKREEDELLGNIEVQEGAETAEEETEVTTHNKNPKSRWFGLDNTDVISNHDEWSQLNCLE
ncbi:DEAD-box helicase family protein [Rhizoctonia solani AG-3 Rhs1AP]|uniref:DNA 3'-5' helicase n=2 Tax=Rhizoctonia solani AG-3 TaxID=1086053 RepID=A0A074RMX1_9AGAM|nr:DEAD-box helicase family protein [Rhizoctonia solani AG-3 Rhs1AP]KEP46068.1 DEAD-box helicase family protein [Rhizoctonia solani 123E]